MPNVTKAFVKDADNVVELDLTENGSPLTNTPTEIKLEIGSVITITRTPTGTGIAFDTGTGRLTVTPADLTEDLSGLVVGTLHKVRVLFTDSTNTNGVAYGAGDSAGRVFFKIETAPV